MTVAVEDSGGRCSLEEGLHLFFKVVNIVSVIELSKETFETRVMNVPEDQVVVVKFYGDNCPMCKAMAEGYESLSDFLKDSSVRFCSVNTDKNRFVALTRRVLSQPTVIAYRNKKEIFRLIREEATADIILDRLKGYGIISD